MKNILYSNYITVSKKKLKLIPYLLLIIYFFAGVVYSISLGNNLRFPDEFVYYTLAGNLADTFQYSLDGKSLTASNPPGYPFFLALLRFFGCNIILLRITNFILLSLAHYLYLNYFQKNLTN